MSESKFKTIQEDVCFKPPEEMLEPDKICPTCIPNPSYVEPDWIQTSEPYLNEKTCEYHLKVMINLFGDVYTEDMTPPPIFKRINDAPYPFDTLLRTYIRPAIRRMLRYYGKLETDDIVCAMPPQARGERCGDVFRIDTNQFVNNMESFTDSDNPSIFEVQQTIESALNAYPEIINRGALEIFAKVKDHTFLLPSKVLAVLVTIPAYKFDAVPQAPDLGSLNTATDKIILRPPDFMPGIDLFKSAMKTFSSYQAFFKQEENASVFEEESGLPFYIKFYAEERISKFVDKLSKLLEDNVFNLRGFLDTGIDAPRIPEEIEVSFDKSDETKPFTIKNVRARLKGCSFVECKIGLEAFIEYSKNEQTMFGYISNFDNIMRELKANKTPPWLDFIVQNTYPQLAINYGSTGNFETSCFEADFSQVSDFILNEVMTFSQGIAYRLNSDSCSTPLEIIAGREKTLKTDEFLELRQGVKTLKENYRQQKSDVKEIIRGLDDLRKKLPIIGEKNLKTEAKKVKVSGAQGALKNFLNLMNPCNLQREMKVAMKCIMAGLSVDEAYYAIIKRIISSAGEQALEVILETLPANKQEQIRQAVEKQFGNMPFPWEPGWEGGNLGESVDRAAREDLAKQSENLVFIDEIEDEIQRLTTLNSDLKVFIESTEKNIEEGRILYEFRVGRTSWLKQDELEEELQRKQVQLEEIDSRVSQPQGLGQLAYNKRQQDLRDREILVIDIDILNSELEETRIITSAYVPREEYVNTTDNEFVLLKKFQVREAKQNISVNNFEIEILTGRLPEAISREAAANPGYRYFHSTNEEEKESIIQDQIDKTTFVKLNPSDQIQTGTLGRALGNVQSALVEVYIEEILKTATVGELQAAIDAIPGGDVLGKLVSKFSCATTPLIYPPIESFLSTLTFDPCSAEKTRLAIPSIQELPLSFNFLDELGKFFISSLKKLLAKVLMALVMKVAELLEGNLCSAVADVTTGDLFQKDGFQNVLEKYFCGDEDPERSRDNVLRATTGTNSPKDSKKLAQALSVSSSFRDVQKAMVGEGDESFLNGISTIIQAAVPEFSDMFADTQRTRDFFLRMGNLLSSEQRADLLNEIDAQENSLPIETSICLTKEQKEQWDIERAEAFRNPVLGREFVDKQNAKALSDLSDAADILFRGPEGILSDAIRDALKSKDPDCKVNSSVIPGYESLPTDKQTAVSNAITGIFKNLEKAFLDDVIGWQWFNPFNTIGVLSLILADRKNRPLNHYLYAKNAPFFLRFIFGGESELPDTIGIQMKEQLEGLGEEYTYRTGFTFKFNNGKEGKDNYSSNIRILDTRGHFDYQLISPIYTLTIDNQNDIPEEFLPIDGETTEEYRARVISLRKVFEKSWQNFQNVTISSDNALASYEGINTLLYRELIPSLLVQEDGRISQGFISGNRHVEITEDDLTYVGPNGEEPYEDFYAEEDAVLGRSKTSNPRVHFLDPAKYGGSYLAPQIYIDEAKHEGWLQFSKIVVPNPTGCDPKNSNFLMLGELIEQIDRNKSRIKSHDGLQTPPECTKELPFDKIANSETLATLEGIVRATIRIYLSDFLIRTMPIFANINIDFNRNFDDGILEYIAENMYNGLIRERSLFASTYEGYTYLLLFLEQVVQIVSRRVKNGDIEANQEISDALEACNTAQEEYVHIEAVDLINLTNYSLGRMDIYLSTLPSEQREAFVEKINNMIAAITSGTAIIAEGDSILDILETLGVNFLGMSLDQARFASKIASIYTVELQCKTLLKYLIKEELKVYSDKISAELSPRPYIYDINKYFIGASKNTLGKTTTSGIYDTEVPIGGGESNFPYGNVNHCAKNDMIHPLNAGSLGNLSLQDLEKNGAFYLEKYLVVKEKKGFELPQKIQNVVNIQEFKEFLQSNFGPFSQNNFADKSISEYFGDAVLSEDEQSYTGTTGIKFGVRLCYIPPENFTPFASITDELSNFTLARDKRSYLLSPCSFENNEVYENSRYSFPVASYEQDILDVKISEILDSDDNLNQDLKCYIDKLAETEEFIHITKNIFSLTKITTALMAYSYENFLFSLGQADTERDEGDDDIPLEQNQLDKIFNDSRREARKLFAAFYKNNDRDPPDEEENNEDLVSQGLRKLTNSLSFVDFGNISFDIRRRIRRDNPFDKDGNECKNNFAKLITIGGNNNG